MKRKILLSFTLTILLFTSIFAQEEPKNSIENLQVIFGGNTNYSSFSTLDDFNSLAPNSLLLNQNLDSYTKPNSHNYTSNSMLAVLVGIKLKNTKTNQRLRVGFNYLTGNGLSSAYYLYTKGRYDTLTSTKTGAEIYLDSSNSKYYNFNYTYQQIRLDASYLFSTDKEARFSWYTGVGLSMGVSLSSQTNIHYSEYTRIYSVDNDDVRYNEFPDNENTSKSESFRNKTNFGVAGYMPLGVDFTIGKKREFWKRTHLFYEVRLGVNLTKIPELRSFTYALVQNGLGLKVTF